jgi:hypothetical protein
MQARIYDFPVGVESSTQPDAGTPTLANDIVTKSYADAIGGAWSVLNSQASPYAVVAGTTIPFTAGTLRTKRYIQGSGGPVTLTANPRIQAGTIDGQEIMLVGCSDTNTVSIDTGNGTQKNGVDVMLNGSVTVYNWDHGRSLWVEISRNNI